jgi:hypothetical protein
MAYVKPEILAQYAAQISMSTCINNERTQSLPAFCFYNK